MTIYQKGGKEWKERREGRKGGRQRKERREGIEVKKGGKGQKIRLKYLMIIKYS